MPTERPDLIEAELDADDFERIEKRTLGHVRYVAPSVWMRLSGGVDAICGPPQAAARSALFFISFMPFMSFTVHALGTSALALDRLPKK